MHDPEFEKQVQKRMEELRFNPSAAVWTTVEKKIRKDKKPERRLFFFFLFLGLGLSGGLYFLFNLNRPETKVAQRLTVQKLQTSDNFSDSKIEKNKIKTGKTEIKPSIPHHEKLNREKTASKKNSPVIKETSTRKEIYPNERPIIHAAISQDAPSKRKEEWGVFRHSNDEFLILDNRIKKSIKKAKTEEMDGAVQIHTGKKEDTEITSIIKMPILSAQSKKADSVEQPSKLPALAKNTGMNHKPSGWKIGFAAGLGFSTIQDGFLKSGTVADPSTLYSSNGGLTPGGGVRYYPSAIQQGISFSAGLFIKRPVSKKISLSVGLKYQYYSTHIQIGNKVDSSKSLIPSPMGANQVVTVNSYYQSGSGESYVNHYHFIELPVKVEFQLNNNRRMPLYWDVGASLSQFINSDGLHYNSLSGIYYKDNGLFNKTHFSFSTGFIIGLNIPHGILQLGPELQFHFTDLLKNNQGNKEHLFFGGIQLAFIPQKK